MKFKSKTCPYAASLRHFITCDACGAPDPPSCCATCQMTFYCHEACAKNHWQVHKAYCKSPCDILQQSNLVLSPDAETGNAKVASSPSSPSSPSTSDVVKKESTDLKPTCDMCKFESEAPLYSYKTRDSNSPCCERRFCLSCINHYEKISTSLMTSSSSKSNPICPCCRCEKGEARAEEGEDIPMTDTDSSKFQLLQAALWTAKAASVLSLIKHDRNQANQKFRKHPHQHPLLVNYANKALDFVEAVLDADSRITAAKVLQGRILGLIGTEDLGLTLLKEVVQKLSSASSSSSSSSAVPVDQQKKVNDLTEQVKHHMMLAEMDQAEALLEEIQNMREQKFVLFVQPADIMELKLAIARLELQNEDFVACQAMLKGIVEMTSNEEEQKEGGSSSAPLPPDQILNAYLLFARCFVEMKQYDKAIEASTLAVNMNKHYPLVHKELVDASYAKGDVELAKSAACRAVLFETPWDEQTKRSNQQTYTDLFGDTIYTKEAP